MLMSALTFIIQRKVFFNKNRKKGTKYFFSQNARKEHWLFILIKYRCSRNTRKDSGIVIKKFKITNYEYNKDVIPYV